MPRVLTSEYWNGHSKNDGCEFKKRSQPSFNEQGKMEKFATDTMINFLNLPNKYLLRSFNKGDVFDANQFPEGTVLKVDYEKLFFDYSKVLPNKLQKPWYHPYTFWGVVCDYETGQTKNLAIACCWEFPMPLDPNFLIHIDAISIPVKIGDVRHKKEKNIFGETNQLLRVNEIGIYEFGKSVYDKAKYNLRSLNPQLQF